MKRILGFALVHYKHVRIQKTQGYSSCIPEKWLRDTPAYNPVTSGHAKDHTASKIQTDTCLTVPIGERGAIEASIAMCPCHGLSYGPGYPDSRVALMLPL